MHSIKNKFALFYVISAICAVVGAILKINHIGFYTAETSLVIALITNVIFIVIGIMEINQSTKIFGLKRALWNICFILIPSITGLFYLIYGRARIV